MNLDRLLEIRLETRKANDLELELFHARCALRRENLRRGVSSPRPPMPRLRALPRLVSEDSLPPAYRLPSVRKAQMSAKPGILIRPALGQITGVR